MGWFEEFFPPTQGEHVTKREARYGYYYLTMTEKKGQKNGASTRNKKKPLFTSSKKKM